MSLSGLKKKSDHTRCCLVDIQLQIKRIKDWEGQQIKHASFKQLDSMSIAFDKNIKTNGCVHDIN